MSPNVAKVVGQLAEQFMGLDRVINNTQASVRELATSMRGLTVEGRQAASAWREAAAAMTQAARAASGARVATGAAAGFGAAAGAAAGGAAAGDYPALTYSPAAPRGRQPSPALPPIPLPYFGRGVVPYGAYTGSTNLPVPYWNGRTGFTTSGPAFTPYGGYTTTPYRGPGTALVPAGGGGGSSGGGNGFTMGPGGNPFGGGFQPPSPYFNQIPLAGVSPPINYRQRQPTNYSPFKLSTAMAGAIPAWMGEEFLKGVFERAASFDATKAGLRAQGFTPDQVKQAEALAFSTQRGLTGTSAKGNIDLVSMLMAVVQDPEEAMKLMPQYAKLGVVLGATGHGGEGAELMDAIRAGEFRGVLTKRNPVTGKNEVNSEGLSNFLKEMVAANIYSHGQIGPSQILQYLRSAGSAGALITDQELFGRTIALQMAMGSGRAGRSLQGFEQQFTAGRMSEATANLLIEMGIIRGGGQAKSNPYLRKAGMGQFLMSPEAMGADAFKEAMDSPVLFTMQKIYPKLQEMLHKKFGKDYDNADDRTKTGMETAMATQIASRIPGGTELSEIIRNVLIISRDLGAFDKAMGRDAYDIFLNNNPIIRQQALNASWTGFETALGNTAMVPAIYALDALTKALNGLAQWAQAHPDQARLALEGLAGAVIALGTGASLAALTALGGAVGLLAGVGAGAVIMANKVEYLKKTLEDWFPFLFKVGSANDPSAPQMPFGMKTVIPPGWASHLRIPGHELPGEYVPPHGPNPNAPNGVPRVGPLFGPQATQPKYGAFGNSDPNNPAAPHSGPNPLGGYTPRAPLPHHYSNPFPAQPGKSSTPYWGIPWLDNQSSPFIPSAFHQFSPPGGGSGGGGNGAPVPVRLVNPGDLVTGVARGITNQTSRPPSGYTGADPTIDPSTAYFGMPGP